MLGLNLFKQHDKKNLATAKTQTAGSGISTPVNPLLNNSGLNNIQNFYRQPDFSWQEVSLDTLKQQGIYKNDEKKKLKGKEVVLDRFTMADGSSIALAPDLGANIMNLKLGDREIIESPLMKNKAADNYVPKIQGAPLITPPNRTHGKIHMPNGKTIDLLPWHKRMWQKLPFTKKSYNYDHGNMIHGRVYKNKWSLDKTEMNQSGDLKITYKFNTKDEPVLKKKFGEAEFKIAYIMTKDPVTGAPKMKTEVEVTNTGNKKSANQGVYPLVGLGFHPYIKVDKGATFSAPVTQQYKVDKDLIPTGELMPPEQSLIQTGIPVSQKKSGLIDTTYTGLVNNYTSPVNGHSFAQTTINLAKGGVINVNQGTDFFNHLTIYNGDPDHLCVEPLSCAADASGLQAKGVAGTSARFLRPGETVRGDYAIVYQPQN